MDFEQEIGRLKETALVVADIQRQQAEVQKMQAEGLVRSERRMEQIDRQFARSHQRMDEELERSRLHQQRMDDDLERYRLHKQHMDEELARAQESYRLHEQRMAHIDMRLAEITDKLDGMIGFMGGQFPPPM